MIEGLVRLFTLVTAVVAVPLLLLFAFRGWTRRYRSELPHWRNATGLASLLIVALVWLWFAFVLVPAAVGYRPLEQHSALNTITEYFQYLLPYYIYPSVVFATALKGVSRFQVLGASLLMMCGFASMVYY